MRDARAPSNSSGIDLFFEKRTFLIGQQEPLLPSSPGRMLRSTLYSTSIVIEKTTGEIADPLNPLKTEATTVLEAAMDILLADASDEAIELTSGTCTRLPDIGDTTREANRKVRELNPQSGQLLGRVVVSLSWTADYSGSIAESGLGG
jgi:hypothetical protein